MNKKSPLLEYEDNFVTSMGAWIPGKGVVLRGKNLFSEFGNKSWFELLLYSITGRDFTTNQIKLFEGMWSICTSYPDPRLWNNRVAAFCGSSRSTGALGLAAGIATSEAKIYGIKPIIKSFDFLVHSKISIDNGVSIESLVKKELEKFRIVSGYGRPVVKEDERIRPLMKLAKELGFDSGEHINLAFAVEKTLIKLGYPMRANIASIAAGLAADQCLNTEEYYYYVINCFTAGLISCTIDAANKPQGALFPIRCNKIEYAGKNNLKW